MRDAWQAAEPVIGSILYLLVTADLLLTVLYARLGGQGVARLGAGFLSNFIGRGVRSFLVALGSKTHKRDAALSFAGPLTVVLLPMAWTWFLTLAIALVIHPKLGTTVVASQGTTVTDFITALYAAGTSLAITGSSEYIPASDAMRLLYLSDSIVGTSVMTLTLTYLMQVYPALQRRNAIAMAIHSYTGRTGDAARFVAALLPSGDVSPTASNLANVGEDLVEVGESYHFYPVLFYFRPPAVAYADVRFVTVALDATTIMRSAVSDDLVRRVGNAAPALLVRDAALNLSKTLEGTFIDEDADKAGWPAPDTEARWRARFDRAWKVLEAARVPLAEDRDAAVHRYIAERSEWQPRLDTLGEHASFGRDEIDPALWPPPRSSIMAVPSTLPEAPR
jgi:hypothetical protein